MSFHKLELIEPIRAALQKEGYTIPTPVQEQAIPIVLQKRDLLACAQTGTGKTAAFAIPIIQLMYLEKEKDETRRKIKCLILTPTRELAIQIGESFTAYGRYAGLKHTVVFGGVSQHTQTRALQNGVDILIATPGRLLDLINQGGFVDLRFLKQFVLDEADRMLDMGFIHDVKKIITRIPERRQTLFFSATMPADIVKLSDSILTNPVRVQVTPVSTTAETIQQSVFYVEKKDKKSLLLHLLENKDIQSALIFTRTKHGANKITKEIISAGIRAEAIHGNKSQTARQNALQNFKAKKTRVLVATDIAARGIDIDELSHVINFELPNVPESYVHRIGRTGRAGAAGIAISFCDAEERAYLRDINKLTNQSIPVIEEHPYHSTETSFVKTPAPGSQPRRNESRNSNSNGNRNANPNSNRNAAPSANGNNPERKRQWSRFRPRKTREAGS